ncbi:LysR family transcriptional regulator [Azoarcus sp. KH32C]|uniref:LysR family transcriptional regulator n=1 Tax=Azoarcus sp. KH32C TaxID=748247 RepID=UPI0002386715|nr:LysR family transcriptional regulator [Azoarcus sp. KH32C]BAL24219.1 transcriptional regulator, LysR family [Azoarcus sp. KH32C]
MLTFKQLEAIYWVVQLGGFSQAAQKLHTTQSAVSKRVQELESLFETPLFDRSLRAARLTEKGEEMFLLAKKLLEQRDAAVDQFSRGAVVERRIRIGVTELTALTWLPRLVNAINTFYPKVTVEPDVDLSVSLRDKLLADEIDLMIAPSAVNDTRFSSVPVGKVENVWMAKPGMIESRRPLRLHELAAHRLLTQGDKSGTGLLYERWFKGLGVKPSNTLTSNNLIALIGFTLSGLGISYLPLKCMEPMIQAGKLEVVKVNPALPKTEYLAMYKGEQRSTVVSSIVMLAQESCDFTRMFDTGPIVR